MMMTRTQQRAEQIAALMAEDKLHDDRIAEAVATSATARCAAVEEMFEVLGIKSKRSDKDEVKRCASLVEAIGKMIEERDELLAERRRVRSQHVGHDTSNDIGARQLD